MLDNSLADEFGGIAYCKQKLARICHVEHYSKWIIIIAGLTPKTGSGAIPESYRQVAELTHQIRFEEYRRGFLKLDDVSINNRESMKWIQRVTKL